MLGNAILLSLREIKRNVLRSFLTILGIVIGVGAVITMVTIGGGATAQVTEQIASMGSNILIVSPGKRIGPGQSTTPTPFKMSDAQAIASDIDSLAAAVPISSQSVTAIFGSENWSTTVRATDNQYFKAANRSRTARLSSTKRERNNRSRGG